MPARKKTLPATRSDFVERIAIAWRKTVDAILEVGRLLIDAKKKLPRQFQAMVEKDLPFGVRTAQMLMAIAQHDRLCNANLRSHLPPSWRALYELSQLSEGEFDKALRQGFIHPEMTVNEASGLVHGAEADEEERRHGAENEEEEEELEEEEEQQRQFITVTTRAVPRKVMALPTYHRVLPPIRPVPEGLWHELEKGDQQTDVLNALRTAAELDPDMLFNQLTQHRIDDIEKVKQGIEVVQRLGERLSGAMVVPSKPR